MREFSGTISQTNNEEWLERSIIINEDELIIAIGYDHDFKPTKHTIAKEKINKVKIMSVDKQDRKGSGCATTIGGLGFVTVGIVALLMGILAGGGAALILFLMGICAVIVISFLTYGIAASGGESVIVSIAFELESKEWFVIKTKASPETIDDFNMHYVGNPFSQEKDGESENYPWREN